MAMATMSKETSSRGTKKGPRSQSYGDLKSFVHSGPLNTVVSNLSLGVSTSSMSVSENRNERRQRSTSYDNIAQATALEEVNEDLEGCPPIGSNSNSISPTPPNQVLLPRQHWQPNSTKCSITGCGKKFGMIERRHHCRKCGKVVCSSCSQGRMELFDSRDQSGTTLLKPQRVCNSCAGLMGSSRTLSSTSGSRSSVSNSDQESPPSSTPPSLREEGSDLDEGRDEEAEDTSSTSSEGFTSRDSTVTRALSPSRDGVGFLANLSMLSASSGGSKERDTGEGEKDKRNKRGLEVLVPTLVRESSGGSKDSNTPLNRTRNSSSNALYTFFKLGGRSVTNEDDEKLSSSLGMTTPTRRNIHKDAGMCVGANMPQGLRSIKYNGGLHVQTDDSKAVEHKKNLKQRMLPKPDTVFEWGKVHELDNRGIIYWLSTAGGTENWRNPADSGIVRVQGSQWSKGRIEDVVTTVAHTKLDSWSDDAAGAWFSVELPAGLLIEPTHYMLRHGYGGGAQLRNWQLLLSADGQSWKEARTHHKDSSLVGGYAVHTWSLPLGIGAARFFKIVHTGANSIEGKQLACCGFEVYGRVVAQQTEGVLNPSHWFFAGT